MPKQTKKSIDDIELLEGLRLIDLGIYKDSFLAWKKFTLNIYEVFFRKNYDYIRKIHRKPIY